MSQFFDEITLVIDTNIEPAIQKIKALDDAAGKMEAHIGNISQSIKYLEGLKTQGILNPEQLKTLDTLISHQTELQKTFKEISANRGEVVKSFVKSLDKNTVQALAQTGVTPKNFSTEFVDSTSRAAKKVSNFQKGVPGTSQQEATKIASFIGSLGPAFKNAAQQAQSGLSKFAAVAQQMEASQAATTQAWSVPTAAASAKPKRGRPSAKAQEAQVIAPFSEKIARSLHAKLAQVTAEEMEAAIKIRRSPNRGEANVIDVGTEDPEGTRAPGMAKIGPAVEAYRNFKKAGIPIRMPAKMQHLMDQYIAASDEYEKSQEARWREEDRAQEGELKEFRKAEKVALEKEKEARRKRLDKAGKWKRLDAALERYVKENNLGEEITGPKFTAEDRKKRAAETGGHAPAVPLNEGEYKSLLEQKAWEAKGGVGPAPKKGKIEKTAPAAAAKGAQAQPQQPVKLPTAESMPVIKAAKQAAKSLEAAVIKGTDFQLIGGPRNGTQPNFRMIGEARGAAAPFFPLALRQQTMPALIQPPVRESVTDIKAAQVAPVGENITAPANRPAGWGERTYKIDAFREITAGRGSGDIISSTGSQLLAAAKDMKIPQELSYGLNMRQAADFRKLLRLKKQLALDQAAEKKAAAEGTKQPEAALAASGAEITAANYRSFIKPGTKPGKVKIGNVELDEADINDANGAYLVQKLTGNGMLEKLKKIEERPAQNGSRLVEVAPEQAAPPPPPPPSGRGPGGNNSNNPPRRNGPNGPSNNPPSGGGNQPNDKDLLTNPERLIRRLGQGGLKNERVTWGAFKQLIDSGFSTNQQVIDLLHTLNSSGVKHSVEDISMMSRDEIGQPLSQKQALSRFTGKGAQQTMEAAYLSGETSLFTGVRNSDISAAAIHKASTQAASTIAALKQAGLTPTASFLKKAQYDLDAWQGSAMREREGIQRAGGNTSEIDAAITHLNKMNSELNILKTSLEQTTSALERNASAHEKDGTAAGYAEARRLRGKAASLRDETSENLYYDQRSGRTIKSPEEAKKLSGQRRIEELAKENARDYIFDSDSAVRSIASKEYRGQRRAAMEQRQRVEEEWRSEGVKNAQLESRSRLNAWKRGQYNYLTAPSSGEGAPPPSLRDKYGLGNTPRGPTGAPVGGFLGSLARGDRSGRMSSRIRSVVEFTAAAQVSQAVYSVPFRAFAAITEADKAMAGIRKVTNSSDAVIMDLRTSAIDAAKKFGSNTADVMNSFQIFAQQGLSSEEIKKRGTQAAKIARVSAMSTEDISETVTAGLKLFGNQVNNSAEGLMDSFLSVEQRNAVTEQDLAEVMRRVGASAGTSGVSLHELNALATVIQERTRAGGEQIGTALRLVFRNLSDSKTINKLYKDFGIQVRDQQTGNLRPGFQVLGDIATKYKTLGSFEQRQLAQEVGDTRFSNIFMNLMEGWGKAGEVKRQSEQGQGTTNQRVDQMMRSMEGQAKRLAAAFDEVAISIGDGLKEPLIESMKVLSGILGGIGKIAGFRFGENGPSVAGLVGQAAVAVGGGKLISGAGRFLLGKGITKQGIPNNWLTRLTGTATTWSMAEMGSDVKDMAAMRAARKAAEAKYMSRSAALAVSKPRAYFSATMGSIGEMVTSMGLGPDASRRHWIRQLRESQAQYGFKPGLYLENQRRQIVNDALGGLLDTTIGQKSFYKTRTGEIKTTTHSLFGRDGRRKLADFVTGQRQLTEDEARRLVEEAQRGIYETVYADSYRGRVENPFIRIKDSSGKVTRKFNTEGFVREGNVPKAQVLEMQRNIEGALTYSAVNGQVSFQRNFDEQAVKKAVLANKGRLGEVNAQIDKMAAGNVSPDAAEYRKLAAERAALEKQVTYNEALLTAPREISFGSMKDRAIKAPRNIFSQLGGAIAGGSRALIGDTATSAIGTVVGRLGGLGKGLLSLLGPIGVTIAAVTALEKAFTFISGRLSETGVEMAERRGYLRQSEKASAGRKEITDIQSTVSEIEGFNKELFNAPKQSLLETIPPEVKAVIGSRATAGTGDAMDRLADTLEATPEQWKKKEDVITAKRIASESRIITTMAKSSKEFSELGVHFDSRGRPRYQGQDLLENPAALKKVLAERDARLGTDQEIADLKTAIVTWKKSAGENADQLDANTSKIKEGALYAEGPNKIGSKYSMTPEQSANAAYANQQFQTGEYADELLGSVFGQATRAIEAAPNAKSAQELTKAFNETIADSMTEVSKNQEANMDAALGLMEKVTGSQAGLFNPRGFVRSRSDAAQYRLSTYMAQSAEKIINEPGNLKYSFRDEGNMSTDNRAIAREELLRRAREGDVIVQDGNIVRVSQSANGDLMGNVLQQRQMRGRTGVTGPMSEGVTTSWVEDVGKPAWERIAYGTLDKVLKNGLDSKLYSGANTMTDLAQNRINPYLASAGFGALRTNNLPAEVETGPKSLLDFSDQMAGTFLGYQGGKPVFDEASQIFLNQVANFKKMVDMGKKISTEAGISGDNEVAYDAVVKKMHGEEEGSSGFMGVGGKAAVPESQRLKEIRPSEAALSALAAGNTIAALMEQFGKLQKAVEGAAQSMEKYDRETKASQAVPVSLRGPLAKLGNMPELQINPLESQINGKQLAFSHASGLFQATGRGQRERGLFQGLMQQELESADESMKLLQRTDNRAFSRMNIDDLSKIFDREYTAKNITENESDLLKKWSEGTLTSADEEKNAEAARTKLFGLVQSRRNNIAGMANADSQDQATRESFSAVAMALGEVEQQSRDAAHALRDMNFMAGKFKGLAAAAGEGPNAVTAPGTRPMYGMENERGQLVRSITAFGDEDKFQYQRRLLSMRGWASVRSGRMKLTDESGNALSPLSPADLYRERQMLARRESMEKSDVTYNEKQQQVGSAKQQVEKRVLGMQSALDSVLEDKNIPPEDQAEIAVTMQKFINEMSTQANKPTSAFMKNGMPNPQPLLDILQPEQFMGPVLPGQEKPSPDALLSWMENNYPKSDATEKLRSMQSQLSGGVVGGKVLSAGDQTNNNLNEAAANLNSSCKNLDTVSANFKSQLAPTGAYGTEGELNYTPANGSGSVSSKVDIDKAQITSAVADGFKDFSRMVSEGFSEPFKQLGDAISPIVSAISSLVDRLKGQSSSSENEPAKVDHAAESKTEEYFKAFTAQTSGQVAAIEKKVEALERQEPNIIRHIENKLKVGEDKIKGEVKQQTDSVLEKVESVRTDVNGLKSRVNSVESTVKTDHARVNRIQGEVNQAKNAH